MSSPIRNILRQAIERGLAKRTLSDELNDFQGNELKSIADAKAVCWGITQLDPSSDTYGDDIHELARFFQQAEADEVIDCLREDGIPALIECYENLDHGNDRRASVRLFLLKILALYGTMEGALKVIDAALKPLEPESYMWAMILGCFKKGHPQNQLFYRSLSDPLPPDFIGISLLDAANSALIEGETVLHPFDSADGREQLHAWLSNSDSEQFSYAHSATAALPFISSPGRERLLNIAKAHPDAGVQLEAAWAAAKVGQEYGVTFLAKQCLDYRHAAVAKRYLTELDREEAIPAECNDPTFSALSEFSNWLAHPNELGQTPDDLTVVDQRELCWPPDFTSKPFWLIKYKIRTEDGTVETDCGLVGSVTFCLFSYKLVQRPPEDAYAIHCCWEMEQTGLIDRTDVTDSSDEYEDLVSQWTGSRIRDARVIAVAEIAPELNYPNRLVALVSGVLNGTKGWAVLDGDKSEWYPKSDFPTDSPDSIVLQIHIGRQILGLTGKPERKKFLKPEKKKSKFDTGIL